MGDPGPGSGVRSISGEVEGRSNVLLLVSPFQSADLDACIELLTLEEPARENVWSLGITLPPNTRVENWEARVGRAPAAFRIVSVGDQPQSRAKATAASYGFEPEPNFVTVPEGDALTRLGVELVAALEEWETGDAETVICFHSVSALLQYADEPRVFRFLNAFTTQVEEAGATAHYHMDPEVHDGSTVANVKHLVDAVIEADDDGAYRVTVR